MSIKYTILIIAMAFSLGACAGPNASAHGNNNGAKIGTDLFKISFP